MTQFFKDLRDIRMMFRSFSSVDRKVKIIQKRWKAKSEVNKARNTLLRAYWNKEVMKIYNIIDEKEIKSRIDKSIMSKLQLIDPELRNLILKDFYFSCIKMYDHVFK